MTSTRANLSACIALVLLASAAAWSQEDEGPEDAAGSEAAEADLTREIQAPVQAVTVYRGRAVVTRRVELPLEPGIWALRFAGLPDTVHPETLQVRVTGPATVLGVEYEESDAEVADPDLLAELDDQIRKVKSELKKVEGQYEINREQVEFLSAVGVRVAAGATGRSGSDEPDLDAVRAQLEFMTRQQSDLLLERQQLDARNDELRPELARLESRRLAIAAGPVIARTAVVSVDVAEATTCQLGLSYLVSEATWQPFYNVRASFADGSVIIEYDAMLIQDTGEDWEDVSLTLSTSQPMVDANPPELAAWFVDVLPRDRFSDAGGRTGLVAGFDADPHRTAGRVGASSGAAAFGGLGTDPWDSLATDAMKATAGPSITFQLPREVTVRSHSQRRQRTRITDVRTWTNFIHVAVPLLTDAVYVRGEVTNASDHQLLPGPAAIFVGQDYVGQTSLDAVAPSGEFEVFFGIDAEITAVRRLVNKRTSKTGLFSGGLRTDYEYRIEIENRSGDQVELELWDRMPVALSDQIRIELVGPSTPLSEDPRYLEEDWPMGLLRWDLVIPSEARGFESVVTTYSVRVNRARDVEMTPLPE